MRSEAFKCQFFTFVSVVIPVVFFSLDCWSLLLEPVEDYSAPVTAEMSDECCFAVGRE